MPQSDYTDSDRTSRRSSRPPQLFYPSLEHGELYDIASNRDHTAPLGYTRGRRYPGNAYYPTGPMATNFQRPRAQFVSNRFGEELAPEAPIWKTYLDEAQEQDRELVEGHTQSLDTLLLFAGLFSAILTAFLIEAKNLLQQDPADASTVLLLLIAQSQQRMELGLAAPEELADTITTPEFTPTLSARWINGIWFTSLGLSLSAAVIAMLGKEWLTAFKFSRPRTPRRVAFIRQSRLKGLNDWGALHIISLLPTLLHLSLLLFSIGLVIYLWELDKALATVLAAIIGATLVFYAATGILAAVYEYCPFVTELSKYMRRAVTPLPKKDQQSESVVSPTTELQALVWLLKHATDPIIVDYAYQAIAGLHQSSFTVVDLIYQRLNPSPQPNSLRDMAALEQDITINSLSNKLSSRFDEILAGTLETDGAEAPVCRYINGMIALGHYKEKVTDAPLEYWFNILDKIDSFRNSDLPQQNMSGNSSAGVLIAEMDVIKLSLDILQSSANGSTLGSGAHASSGTSIEHGNYASAYNGPHIIDIQSTNTQNDNATSDPLQRISIQLAAWLESSLNLLESHATKGTFIRLDPYLQKSLLRATTAGADSLNTVYRTLCKDRPIALTPDAVEDIFQFLNILISLLLQHIKQPGPLPTIVALLKTYSYTLPILLHHQKQLDWDRFGDIFRRYDPDTAPPTVRHEALSVCVHFMMISASYICCLLPSRPQYGTLLDKALEVVYQATKEPGHPREAFQYHVGDYVRILEFIQTTKDDVELITKDTASKLIILTIYPQSPDMPNNGWYLSPPCILTLLRLYGRANVGPAATNAFMETIVGRLRSPTIPFNQLPPQTYPLTESRPSIEYLQQITRCSGGFASLLPKVPHHGIQPAEVSGIAKITIIAANQDPALVVNPVELRAPVVSEFLHAVSWTLHDLSPEEDADLYDRFIVSAAILVEVACEDSESREKVATYKYPVWMTLLKALRARKDIYLTIISESEWKRLVRSLELEELNADEEGSGEPIEDEEKRSGERPKSEQSRAQVERLESYTIDGVENREVIVLRRETDSPLVEVGSSAN